MVELKPCPFCGGEAYFCKPLHENGTAFDMMAVECKQCGAHPYGVLVYEFADLNEKYETIARFWNRRAES